jgi:hypothetical protein
MVEEVEWLVLQVRKVYRTRGVQGVAGPAGPEGPAGIQGPTGPNKSGHGNFLLMQLIIDPNPGEQPVVVVKQVLSICLKRNCALLQKGTRKFACFFPEKIVWHATMLGDNRL